MPACVAIVGAGPSGFYTAGSLLDLSSDITIDMIEALPTPFGLVRAGVAPDHQNTKAITKVFNRIAASTRFKFYGNVEVGREITMAELRTAYDAVVLACGSPIDQPLNVPGASLDGVYGSAQFVGWYNGHPRFRNLEPKLQSPSVVIIGNGNVALDIARVLTKTPREMASSDLAQHAATLIHDSPIQSIHIVGRRGPQDARFTNKELSELGALADCVPSVEGQTIPEQVIGKLSKLERKTRERNLATLRSFAIQSATQKKKRVQFHFYAKPVEILGHGAVDAIRLERTEVSCGRIKGNGEMLDLPCGTVISAIGYRSLPPAGVPLDSKTGAVKNQEGEVEPGLYVVGWARRGPSGVIGTNRSDGEFVAERVLQNLQSSNKPGGVALEESLHLQGARWTSFEDWLRIDAAETAAAAPGAPRKKFTTLASLLEVLE